MNVAEIRVPRCVSECIVRDRIINEYISKKLKVALIEDKMNKN